MSVTPQHLVDALGELAAALARLEAAQQEMAARVEAAADRAAAGIIEARRAVELVLDARLGPLIDLRRHVEALDRTRAALERETARRRLAWSVEVPAWRWLLGSLGTGAALGVAGWLGLVAPALGPIPAATPATAVAPAPAAGATSVVPVRPPAAARDRSHAPSR